MSMSVFWERVLRPDIGVFVASNWAMGTFVLISLGSWYVLHIRVPAISPPPHPLHPLPLPRPLHLPRIPRTAFPLLVAHPTRTRVISSYSYSIPALHHSSLNAHADAPHGHRTICQKNRTEERRRVQQVVEAIPKRFVKKESGEGGGEQKTA